MLEWLAGCFNEFWSVATQSRATDHGITLPLVGGAHAVAAGKGRFEREKSSCSQQLARTRHCPAIGATSHFRKHKKVDVVVEKLDGSVAVDDVESAFVTAAKRPV